MQGRPPGFADSDAGEDDDRSKVGERPKYRGCCKIESFDPLAEQRSEAEQCRRGCGIFATLFA